MKLFGVRYPKSIMNDWLQITILGTLFLGSFGIGVSAYCVVMASYIPLKLFATIPGIMTILMLLYLQREFYKNRAIYPKQRRINEYRARIKLYDSGAGI